MAFTILMTAAAFSQLLAYTGGAVGFVKLVAGFHLSPLQLMVLMQLTIVVLGCFLDSISIIVLTTPIFMPIVLSSVIDPIWYGICVIVNLDLGGKTPPFGMLLFVFKGIYPKMSMGDIIRSISPFLIIQLLVITMMILFPDIATYVPSLIE